MASSTSAMVRENNYIILWDTLFDKKCTPWMSFKPEPGMHIYVCYACQDMYRSKNSFLDHVNRRGLLIKYNCQCSTRILQFYNPCAFLLHVREHFDSNSGKIHLDKIQLSTLQPGLVGFLPDARVPMIYNVDDDEEDDDEEVEILNNKFYSPLQECKSKSIVFLIPTDLTFLFYSNPSAPVSYLILKQVNSKIPRCKLVTVSANAPNSVNNNSEPICNTDVKIEPQDPVNDDENQYKLPVITKVETIKDLNDDVTRVSNLNYSRCPECKQLQSISMSDHFLITNIPFQDHLKCSICKYIAPTKCSLQAHERIHNSFAPFVCPECGRDFTDWKQLYSHMEDTCFHMTKQVRHKCPAKKCGKVFAQFGTFASHFLLHLKSIINCSTCHASFPNEIEFSDHSESHTRSFESYKTYECLVCTNLSTVFSESNFLEHIEYHATDKKQYLYVYICKHCHSYFRSTSTYATHLLRCSKLQLHLLKSRNSNMLPKFNSICYYCKVTKLQSGNKLGTHCGECGEKLICKKILTQENLEILYKIVPTNSLRSHLDQTYLPQNTLSCILCQRQLTIDNVENHFTLQHCKFNNPQIVLTPSMLFENGKENINSVELDDENSKSKDCNKKKRKLSSSFVTLTKKMISCTDGDVSLNLEEPTPFDGVYRCKICKYENTNRNEFCCHIITHRDVSTSYQCMECGECFVVKPSLTKHLLYYHDINDVEEYFKNNNCFDKEAVMELEQNMRLAPGESKKPVTENQCTVCFLQCSDEHELKKHYRTHGMAFILKNSK